VSWVGDWLARRRATRGAVVVYVSEAKVVVVRHGVVLASLDVIGRDAAMSALEHVMRELPRGSSIQVAAAASWCRPFLVPEVEGARQEELRTIASSMVESMTGLPAQSRVWVDVAGAGGTAGAPGASRVAVAADAAWLQGLETSLGRSLRSVRPWWAMAIDAVAASARTSTQSSTPHAGLVAIEPEGFVLMLADGEAYRVAQWYELHDEDADTVLSRALVSHHLTLEQLAVVRWDERLFSMEAAT